MVKRAERKMKCCGCTFPVLKGWWIETINGNTFHENCLDKAHAEAPVEVDYNKKLEPGKIFRLQGVELEVVRVVKQGSKKVAHCRETQVAAS